MIKVEKVIIMSSGKEYAFKLPKPVDIPEDLSGENKMKFLIFTLLGLELETEGTQ